MALHIYRGIMGCTHGRTYPRLIKGARHEDATNTAKLMFGMGLYCNPATMGTVMLATSSYRCPELFAKIAGDLVQPRLFKERHSIERVLIHVWNYAGRFRWSFAVIPKEWDAPKSDFVLAQIDRQCYSQHHAQLSRLH